MTYKILAQDKHGNWIIDRYGWELELEEGWHQIGYDDHSTIAYTDLLCALDADSEDLVMDYVNWLVRVSPSSVHVLSYQETHGGFCNDCRYVVSCYPVDHDYFKLNFELYKLVRKSS